MGILLTSCLQYPQTQSSLCTPPRPQALLGSTRFCTLLGVLRDAAPDLDPSATPTLAALAALASEFPTLQQAAAGQTASGTGEAVGKVAAALSVLLGGQPFLPDMLLDVVSAFRPVAHPGSSSSSVVLGADRRSNGMLALEVRCAGHALRSVWQILVYHNGRRCNCCFWTRNVRRATMCCAV